MPWKKGNRLRIVSEHDASGRTREIFDAIKSYLGLPHVGLVFQAYAAYPDFLNAHWTRLRPVVQRPEFFSLAARLRADAYTRMHNYFAIPALEAPVNRLGNLRELCEVVDLFHYSNPLELLIVATQWQALDGPVGRQWDAILPSQQSSSLAERAVPSRSPMLIPDQPASPPLLNLYDEVKRTLAIPQVDPAFQAIARWPEFFQSYWKALQQVLQSPLYQECLHGMYESAWTLAHELPGTVELTPDQLAELGLEDQDIASVVRITELFVRMTAGMALNLAFAKIVLEGGNRPQMTIQKPAGEPQQAA